MRGAAWEQVLRAQRVRVGERVVSLKALRDRVARERREYEAGAYEESLRCGGLAGIAGWVVAGEGPRAGAGALAVV